MANLKLILASSSPYRRELLDRLHLRYTATSPDIDESYTTTESADAVVRRLARSKAEAVAVDFPDAVVIGADQVLTCAGDVLAKPGNFINACAQLRKLSGQTAVFSTGICVYDAAGADVQTAVVDFRVDFRDLSDAEIERYLHLDQPYDCAGSFKSEGYGITLARRMSGDDPTSLVGLPLIELSRMLRNRGFELP